MEIYVRAHKVKADEDVLRAKATEALERFADRLTRVDVYVTDVNVGKGGIDKRCVIEARPRGMDPIAVEHSDTEVHLAAGEAAQKLGRALANRFGKLDDRH